MEEASPQDGQDGSGEEASEGISIPDDPLVRLVRSKTRIAAPRPQATSIPHTKHGKLRDIIWVSLSALLLESDVDSWSFPGWLPSVRV